MSVYLRGKIYYMRFTVEGISVCQSCKTTRKHEALLIERREKKRLKEMIASPEVKLKRETKGMQLEEALDRQYERTWRKQKDGKSALRNVEEIIRLLGNPYLEDINCGFR